MTATGASDSQFLKEEPPPSITAGGGPVMSSNLEPDLELDTPGQLGSTRVVGLCADGSKGAAGGAESGRDPTELRVVRDVVEVSF